MHHAVNPDPYRGAFGSDAEKYARDVQEIIEFGTTGQVVGFIAEAIQVRFIYTNGVAVLACSPLSRATLIDLWLQGAPAAAVKRGDCRARG